MHGAGERGKKEEKGIKRATRLFHTLGIFQADLGQKRLTPRKTKGLLPLLREDF